MLQTETFIARRLGIRGRSSGIMIRVATFSVAVSLIVMLIALGVVNGFRQEVGAKMAGFASHIQITALESGHSYESLPLTYDPSFVEDLLEVSEVERVQRFAAKAGILRGDSTIQGILLKGVGSDFDTVFLHKQLVAGYIPGYTDTVRNREAVVSLTLARTMGLELGDRFSVLFVGSETTRNDWLKVAGIYNSGMPEFDKLLVIGDISVVQRLNNWSPEEISGYEVTVRQAGTDVMKIEEVAFELTETVHPTLFPGWGDAEDGNTDLEVSTIYDRYPQIFDWLEMLGLNTLIVIVIMIVVAVVNMISGVLIVVLEQTRTIGILKALGMRGRMLQRIFIYRTASITLRGMFWGNLIGLALCLVQQYTGWIALDAENYMISTVPIHIDWLSVVLLNAGTFAIITLMMTLPTFIISRITPDKAIRFQ